MKLNPTVMGFFKKELVQTLRDPRMRIMLFVMPIIQMTVFGVAISTETRNIKLAAAYQPNDISDAPDCGKVLLFAMVHPGQGIRRRTDTLRWIQSGPGRRGAGRPRKGCHPGVGRGGADPPALD